MDYSTRIKLIKEYKLPQEVQDFLDKNGCPMPYSNWYSENGKLKI